MAAGFDELMAQRLAACDDVDLHAVLTLLDHGCPPRAASRIVATMVVRHR